MTTVRKLVIPALAAIAMLAAAAPSALAATSPARAATSRSATPASTIICGGTSLRTGIFGLTIRVPTVGNGTPGKWGCNLLPSNTAGLVPVERLQIDLNDCYGFALAVDGEYGPATTAAVRAVQAEEGVSQDGDYGPQTIEGGFEYQASGQPVGICDQIV